MATFVIMAPTSSSVTLSITGFGLIVKLISAGIACGLTLIIKGFCEIYRNKNNQCKMSYERPQQNTNYFDKLYRKCLQDKVIDEEGYDSLCNIFTNYVNESEKHSFLKKYKVNIKKY